jgi:hypothetical protein
MFEVDNGVLWLKSSSIKSYVEAMVFLRKLLSLSSMFEVENGVSWMKYFSTKSDVIAMSSVYYSRDIGVKSLALFLLNSNLLVRLKPWALAQKAKGLKS